MRLHRLEVVGFGPFRRRQIVDFDAFADDGIFLIAGRTGAGKSSILDAICFGLYGGVPRYSGGEKRLRSDHCEPDDPTEVVVEFSTVAGRFRVTRSPAYDRPKKRGGGFTEQAASAALEELTDAGWVGRAARAVDVAGELADILQLTQEQFLQVILLAQNRFADFLLSDSRERQQLLRRLFGTERFRDLQDRFDERRKAAEQALSARRATVDARLEQAEGIVAEASGGADGSVAAPADSSVAEPVDSSVAEPVDSWVAEPVDSWVAEPVEAAQAPGTAPSASSGQTPGAQASVDDRLDALGRALARGEYRAERLDAERDEAEKRLSAAGAALTALKEQRQAQTERDRARAALAELEARAGEIAAATERRDRARSAEGLRSGILATTRAEAALTQAQEAEASARAAWDAHDVLVGAAPERGRAERDRPSSRSDFVGARSGTDEGRSGTDEGRSGTDEGRSGTDEGRTESAALRDWASARTRESGAWQRAAELEQQASERASALSSARDAVTEATEALAEVGREREALPALIADLTERRDTARRSADRVADLTTAHDVAVRRRDAAIEVEQHETAQIEAERAVVAATRTHAEAQAVLAALRQRRLDGFAGELASALVPGEPCAVCGATEHPSPAEHADPVSPDDIAAAERARDAAASAERAASEQESAARAALVAVRERADGRTGEQAAVELEAAAAELSAARAAADQLAELQAELQSALRRAEQNEQQRADADRHLSAAREKLALAEQSAAQADAQIAEARGQHASVGERLRVVAQQIADATALAEALDAQDAAAAQLTLATTERDAALADSPFDDAPAAQAALLSAADLADLDRRLTDYAVAREKERAILLELELRTLPEEPIDLAPAEQAVAGARSTWMSTVSAASEVRSTVTQLRTLIDSAAAEHAASADEQAEFEVVRGLADALGGRGGNTYRMNLETFVLAAELEEIVTAANLRLSDMSAGRYQLQHSDAKASHNKASGLGIVVFDAFTGQTRPARSLSGGETFLSSLALALGLAEVVTARAGGIRLDTLFIDEGFGSLDSDTLEVAMRTLDELRQGGRTVGVISHVEAMQEQIPAQLRVRTLPDGASAIDAPR